MNTILILAAVATIAAVALGLGARARASRDIGQASGPVEARKNTLRGALQDLGLGINQVQGYIDKMEPGKDQTQADMDKIKAQAQRQLDAAKAVQTQVTEALEKATSDAQLDSVELKMEAARVFIRGARRLSHSDDED